MTLTLTRPSPGTLHVPFGPRPKPTPTSPAIHYGEDYGWGNGWVIFAAAAGVVKSYGDAGAYGNRLVIDHGDYVETWYCHTERLYAGIAVGQRVTAGQPVAIIGATGNTVGPHLHFELRIRGTAVDPAPYYRTTAPAADELEEIDPMPTLDEYAAAAAKATRAEVAQLLTQSGTFASRFNSMADRTIRLEAELGDDLEAKGLDGTPVDIGDVVTWMHRNITAQGRQLDAIMAHLGITPGTP